MENSNLYSSKKGKVLFANHAIAFLNDIIIHNDDRQLQAKNLKSDIESAQKFKIEIELDEISKILKDKQNTFLKNILTDGIRLPFDKISVEFFHGGFNYLTIAKQIGDDIHVSILSEPTTRENFNIVNTGEGESVVWGVFPNYTVIHKDLSVTRKDSFKPESRIMIQNPKNIKRFQVFNEIITTSEIGVMYLCAMLSCKNIVAETSPKIDAKMQKKQVKKNGTPFFEHKILVVNNYENTKKDEGEIAEEKNNTKQYRQHLRRGHIRRLNADLEDGDERKRNVWVTATVVNGNNSKTLTKDYIV